MGFSKKEAKRRLLERVRHEGDCWIFTGSINAGGYGILYVGFTNGRRVRLFAHRVAYEVFVAEIPTDVRREIHHKCATPACVNPAHLKCLTRSEHARLNDQFTRGTCLHGHPRTPENTYTNAQGHRYCRVCGAERAKATRHSAGLKGGPGVHWRSKTHCPQGHPYDDDNTKIRAGGGRACRQCLNAASRRYRARKRL